jgi:tetratricopeptide (TPR) repeat protein
MFRFFRSEQENEPTKIEKYLASGKANISNNQRQTAIQNYEKAREIATEQGYRKEETEAYLGLAHAYRLDNKNRTAIRNYEKALEIAGEQRYRGNDSSSWVRKNLFIGNCRRARV